MSEPVLTVRGLGVSFRTSDGQLHAVKGIDLDVAKGETVAIVGESGSGKSQTVMALMGLLASNGEATGSARYRGRELIGLSARDLDTLRGSKLTMIFQEPMTSLDPLYRIGQQMAAPLIKHGGLDRSRCARKSHRPVAPHQGCRSRAPHRQLSARTVRRPAPARDDRHGAREHTRCADRGRADDRPRCHGAGAHPRAAGRSEATARHGHRVHLARSRRRPPHRRPRLCHAPRRGRRAGPDRRHLRGTAASLHADADQRRAARPQVAAGSRRAGRARRARHARDIQNSEAPVQAGTARHQGRRRRLAQRPARRDGRCRRRKRLRQIDARSRAC